MNKEKRIVVIILKTEKKIEKRHLKVIKIMIIIGSEKIQIIIKNPLTNSFHDKNRFLKEMYCHNWAIKASRFEIHKQKILEALSDIFQIHYLISLRLIHKRR